MTDALGKPLHYTINKTMMRVELPAPLKPGQKFIFKIDWNYKITDRKTVGGRGGYEYFPEDGNYLFTMTQWYPRLCVYSDFQGWQNNQFTGRGEFALTFGNFNVKMTVPADHVIGGTGQCQNYQQVPDPRSIRPLATGPDGKGTRRDRHARRSQSIRSEKEQGQERPGSSRPITSATSPGAPPANSSWTPCRPM